MAKIYLILVFLLSNSLLCALDPWGDPVLMAGSMTVMAEVWIEDIPASAGDMVGAFVNNGGTPELRGKQVISVIGGISGCLLQIFTQSNGEEISFRVWDESTSSEFHATQSIVSEVNAAIGSFPEDMYQITAYSSPQINDPWQEPQILSGSMSVSTRVSIHGLPASVGDIVAAFVGNELRGKEPVQLINGQPGCLIQVFTDTDLEQVIFKVWDYSTQSIFTDPIPLSTTVGGSVGEYPNDLYHIAAGDLLPQVSTPIFSLPEGTYSQYQSLEITCPTPGAQIRYTVNGSLPSPSSPLYTGVISIPLNTTLTIHARSYLEGWLPSEIVQATYVTTGTVLAPVFDPPPGIYTTPQNVTITTGNPSAQIRYTLDGSIPTIDSALYTAPLNVESSTQITARAYLDQWEPSAVVNALYTITGTVVDPVFDPPAGNYESQVTISILCATPGATVYYTLNNTEPTENHMLYTQPFTLNFSTTVKARAFYPGWAPSQIVTAEYSVNQIVANPVFSPEPGYYDSPITVSIACATPGAQIRITTNGVDPTPSSLLYDRPLFIGSDRYLKAKAFMDGWSPSSTVTGIYTITGVAQSPEFDPPGDTYTSTQYVSLSSATANAEIRYTTTGAEPNASSTLYTAPIAVHIPTTIRAKAFRDDLQPSPSSSAHYNIIGTVEAPIILPPGGIFPSPRKVSITCATPGVQIRYSIDGSEPNISSIEYQGPFTIHQSCTLKTKAFHPSWGASPSSVAEFTINGMIPSPIFDPPGGSYSAALNVEISCIIPEATIRFTTDGCEPDEYSQIYTSPLHVSQNTTIKARSYLELWETSETSVAVYEIYPIPNEPEFSPEGGTYHTPQNVHVSTSTADAEIRYTTDGTEPNIASPLYHEPVLISTDTTLKAKAFTTNGLASPTTSATYTIVQTVATPLINPNSGIYHHTQLVFITCDTPGAMIRYTLDGSEPLPDSHLYSVPIQILESTVVTARAYRNGWLSSGISSAEYIITGTVALPTLDPPPGNYETSQSVAIICSTPGATIYYTTDGSDPGPESEMYHTLLNISQTTTIKARAYLMNWATSPISLATYGFPVELQDAQNVPSISEILQIYPNPFRDVLTVKLSVNNIADSYQFIVYNLKGECLHTHNGTRKGVFEIAWDGKDSRGKRLPSGVYLLRLITGTEISTRKVVIR